MKKTIIITLFCLIFLTGCEEFEYALVPEDTETPRLSVTVDEPITFTHEIEGIKIRTLYEIQSKDGINRERWRITESKFIKYSLILDEYSESEVLVEHVHLDIALKSVSEQLNERIQDSMDDSYHGYSQDGFLVTDNYSYSEIFAVEGYSQDLFEIWGSVYGSYGQLRGSEKKLTEANLLNAGVYGMQLSTVYNLLIKHPGEEMYHTVPISDQIIISAAFDEAENDTASK